MKKIKKEFWYFVIIAPILAKLGEWIFQYLGYGGGNEFFIFLKHAWIFQLIFIELLALGVYYILTYKKYTIYRMSFIVGIAYFLKEVYNLIVVTQILNQSSIIALTLEPIFMWFILGYLPYKLYFGGKHG